jgi:hypothetical protein
MLPWVPLPPGTRARNRRNSILRTSQSGPSRPGEFHPQPLTEPDVSLSTYPARATHRRLPPSAATSGFLLEFPVDPIGRNASDPLPSLHGHYPASSLLRSSPPLFGASVLSASRFAACAFSLAIAKQVLKFPTKAQIRVTPPLHRTPHGQ